MSSALTLPLLQSLLEAFGYNLLVAISAMTLGYPLGVFLAYGTIHHRKPVQLLSKAIQSLLCNVPSFVMLFYLALIMPSKWEVMAVNVEIPPVAKAILALSIPIIGYSCDSLRYRIKRGQVISYSALKQFFLIILMASTTASAIDVPEILSTANTYIASSGQPELMLPIYATVAVIFVLSGVTCQLIFKALRYFLSRRKRITK